MTPRPLHRNAISLAKAVGILLMVLGHAGGPAAVRHWMVMFHMPLFFVLSGYCLKPSYFDAPGQFLMRRVRGLYLPFVRWSLLFLLLHPVFCWAGIYNDTFVYGGHTLGPYDGRTFIEQFCRVFLMSNEEWLLGGYWFIRQLFYASVLSFLALRAWRRPLHIATAALVLATVFAAFDFHVYGIDINRATFIGVACFCTGAAWRDKVLPSRWSLIGVLFAAVCAGAVYWRTSMREAGALQVLPYYATAIAGSAMTYLLCQKATRLPDRVTAAFHYVGNHTMEILTFHLLSFRLFSALAIGLDGLAPSHLGDYPVIVGGKAWYWVGYFVCGVAVPMLCCRMRDLIMSHILHYRHADSAGQ